MLFCAILVVPILTVANVQSEWVAIALLSLAAGAHQGWSANLFTTTSDMFPRSAEGAVVGIGGMAGAVGGALFAYFTGHVLQITHGRFLPCVSAYLALVVVSPLTRLKRVGWRHESLLRGRRYRHRDFLAAIEIAVDRKHRWLPDRTITYSRFRPIITVTCVR